MKAKLLANLGVILLAMASFLWPQWSVTALAQTKIACGPTLNTSSDLPKTIAIGTNLAGTGAHALGSGLAAVASKITPIIGKVQPYNGPNAWMPLMDSGELEFGIMNIIDAKMAATGTGNYKKAYPTLRVATGGMFPFTGSMTVRDKSDIKQIGDLKGKRVAWDFGGHAITQTWQSAALETGGIKASDVVQVRFSNLNDALRAVPEGKVDASFSAIGIGIVEEANAMEPIRFLNIPPNDNSNRILAQYGGSVVKSDPAAGIRGDTTVIGYPLHLVTSTKLSERTVSTLVKVWLDNLAELQTIHPLFKKWTKENQVIDNFTIPYHPGAVKFYKEAGMWSAKHDARTKEICS
ncbi:MAG: TAXI family TRAP transporter solute-binding subunit [Deltaproteobacteria bacterium]|nr:TAXI family TRAP transporter solute-binding subunit [Deltaproteobacteria bacterium]